MVELSVIIVNWNTCQLLDSCLSSVYETKEDLAVEIIVVDNSSSDGSLQMLKDKYPEVSVIRNPENVGFARANNQGFGASKGRYILLLNSDAILLDGALQELIQLANSNPKIGLVGARLINQDGSFQASFTNLPNLLQELLIVSGVGRLVYGKWYPSHGPAISRGPQSVGYVEGACMLIRRAPYEEIGGMDESYFMYSEDVELCKALHDHGWVVMYQPTAKVIHLGGGSSKHRRPQREADLYQSKVSYYRRHHGNFQADLVKGIIFIFACIKLIFHRSIKIITHGRYGREVVSLRYLISKLKRV